MSLIMNRAVALAAGALAMYYLDPEMGKRRRALVRDKMTAGRHDVERYARKTATRATDQLKGAAATIKSRADKSSQPENDQQLAERVRSQIGRIVSNPGAVTVQAEAGKITLEGNILSSERSRLVTAVADIEGVRWVDDRLTIHDAPGNVPDLQGAGG